MLYKSFVINYQNNTEMEELAVFYLPVKFLQG
jgi:hypothetical protein